MTVRSDTGPFALVPEWVLDADLSDRAIRLYALLSRYADADGICYPSRRALAERLRCSEDSVDRAKRELVAAGALHVEARFDEEGQRSNLYRIVRVLPADVRPPLVTDAAPPLRSGAAQNENHVGTIERPSVSRARAAPMRPRNEVWDALVEIFGEPTTESARTRRGKVCRSLTAARASPEEILRRARRWPRYFGDATLTDTALEKHWDALGRPPLRSGAR